MFSSFAAFIKLEKIQPREAQNTPLGDAMELVG
jgi:hypothetical protein